jgi:small subunit ribosomal protein S4
MARYIGPICKKCRREGIKLFLKGEKCFFPKCPLARRSYKPGMHGAVFKKLSEYGIQLREKQKAKAVYGVLEKQFKKYFQKASRVKGNRGEILLQLLERRLDNVVYRLGFTSSRRAARIFITHGHFLINGKKINIPSYLVQENDKIEVKKKSQKLSLFIHQIKKIDKKQISSWLKFDKKNLTATVSSLPKREEIETDINEQLIIEFYSR